MSTVRPDRLEPHDFPVVFGRFTLHRLLGEGGMARVFEAELLGHGGFRKRLAIKVIRRGFAGSDHDRKLRRALIHEARLGGLLHHPNVVETYDFGETGGQAWIAMELVLGDALSDVLGAGRPLPPDVSLEIASQICAGLHHAHTLQADGEDRMLVHRDLKPSNVIVGSTGLVKVLDFGIAKATHLHGNTTETGMTKGTPAYMSPEQAAGAEVDARSDLFAVGALLFEMLTGRRFFEGDSVYAIMMRILQIEDLLSDEQRWAECDARVPGVSAVVRRCMRADKADRYPSAQAVEADLRRLQGVVTPPGPIARWLQERAEAPPLTQDLEALSLDAVEPVNLAATRLLRSAEEPSVTDPREAEATQRGLAPPAPREPRPAPSLTDELRVEPAWTDVRPGGDRTRPMASAGSGRPARPATASRAAAPPGDAGPTRLVAAEPARERGGSRAVLLGSAIGLLGISAAVASLVFGGRSPEAPPAAEPPVVASPTPAPSEAAATLSPPPAQAPPQSPAPTPRSAAKPTPTPKPSRQAAAQPSPEPEPAVPAAPTPRSTPRPSPRATPKSTPRPASIALRHTAPNSVAPGTPVSMNLTITGGSCRPQVQFAPWDGGSYESVAMTGGPSDWEAELFVPYDPAYQAGLRYRLRCYDGSELVAKWPAGGGSEKVRALVR